MRWAGLEVDDAKNVAAVDGREHDIATEGSRVRVSGGDGDGDGGFVVPLC